MKMWPWKTARRTPRYSPDTDTQRPAWADEDDELFEDRLAEWSKLLERDQPNTYAEP